MDSFKDPCPHRSVPVEMDETMTSSNLDLAWPPPCQHCSERTETTQRSQNKGCEPAGGSSPVHRASQWKYLEARYQQGPRESRFIPPTYSGPLGGPHPADVWPRDPLVNHGSGFSNEPQEHSAEDLPSLEPPFPLRSDFTGTHFVPPRFPAARGPAQCADPAQGGRHACRHPVNLPHHNYNYYNYNHDHPVDPHQAPQHVHQSWLRPSDRGSVGPPQRVAPPAADVMQEVSVASSLQARPAAPTREIRRTISLPAECRNVFITYSIDTAREMIPFTKFLTDQGFNPAIDIFDSRLRAMGITRWMDRYLNDKSVLIIVVISPKYKEDVEGAGDDEHGLHTKYIHNQIQNEFIQQGCLNFRLVPVLFPSATKKHVPSWLQSTTIYRWPHDTQDLLLRLLREERYIMPRVGTDLTLTVRQI